MKTIVFKYFSALTLSLVLAFLLLQVQGTNAAAIAIDADTDADAVALDNEVVVVVETATVVAGSGPAAVESISADYVDSANSVNYDSDSDSDSYSADVKPVYVGVDPDTDSGDNNARYSDNYKYDYGYDYLRPRPRPSSCIMYEVRSGDYCYKIAEENNMPYEQFLRQNPGINCKGLRIGQSVCLFPTTLPGNAFDGRGKTQEVSCTTYVVKEGDLCSQISRENGLSIYNFIKLNDDSSTWKGCTGLEVGQKVCVG
ncbi:hypothetical protein BX661DRAFT_184485 [Kickxella alabastrina]|uniref:uncharacterized protein n=1 Tax=Kickxella alabastrina TaxID=61397 RepID=UPI00222005B6|nr:uncharacterized protein BX661DRAFT_184485 [Kickxella alabastrina]KAI7825406.1 hypothetical protein BX661DRAFT_184485 [Kickxella alabastrina]KAJ1943039.1 hypothetical protein GGF37_002834 [Kickxella alabastrina]